MSWYSGKDLNEAIHRYHDNHTRQSLQQYQQARLVCVQLVQVIANYLSSQTPQLIVHRLLPVEDVADENDRLQFCVHFVVVSSCIISYLLLLLLSAVTHAPFHASVLRPTSWPNARDRRDGEVN